MIYSIRADAKCSLKDYQGAIDDCTKAIELVPNDPYLYFLRANAKYYLEDFQDAIHDYCKAIEWNPTYELREKILKSRSKVYRVLSNLDFENSQN